MLGDFIGQKVGIFYTILCKMVRKGPSGGKGPVPPLKSTILGRESHLRCEIPHSLIPVENSAINMPRWVFERPVPLIFRPGGVLAVDIGKKSHPKGGFP
jgi:hypothetical protein